MIEKYGIDLNNELIKRVRGSRKMKNCCWHKKEWSEMEKMEELGKNPIIVTSPIVRLYFKKLTEEQFQDLIVVSYNEIDSNVELQSIGMVTV